MLLGFLLETVVGIVLGLVESLPVYQVDTAALNLNAAQIGSWAMALNGYAPIAQLGIALGILVGLKLVLLTWQVVAFIYHQFWGSS